MKKNSPAISAMDKKYFRELFSFYATENDKLTYEGLLKIFK